MQVWVRGLILSKKGKLHLLKFPSIWVTILSPSCKWSLTYFPVKMNCISSISAIEYNMREMRTFWRRGLSLCMRASAVCLFTGAIMWIQFPLLGSHKITRNLISCHRGPRKNWNGLFSASYLGRYLVCLRSLSNLFIMSKILSGDVFPPSRTRQFLSGDELTIISLRKNVPLVDWFHMTQIHPLG